MHVAEGACGCPGEVIQRVKPGPADAGPKNSVPPFYDQNRYSDVLVRSTIPHNPSSHHGGALRALSTAVLGNSTRHPRRSSDNWKGTTMTTFNAIDINTFCPLPTHIETSFGSDGTEWFVLDQQLQEQLALPEEFDHHECLTLEDWCLDLVEREDGWHEEVELVSEAGLYMLVLMSTARAVHPFKSWVLDVVAPILAEDGLYAMGEERTVPAPVGYDLSHKDIWSGDLEDTGDAVQLAMHFLPDLRETAMTDCGVIQVIDGNRQVDPGAVALAMARRRSGRLWRQRPDDEKAVVITVVPTAPVD